MQVTNLFGHKPWSLSSHISHVKFHKLTTTTAVHLELTYHEVPLLKQQLYYFHLLHWVYVNPYDYIIHAALLNCHSLHVIG